MKCYICNWHSDPKTKDKLAELGYKMIDGKQYTEYMELSAKQIVDLSEHFNVCILRKETGNAIGVTNYNSFGPR